jgi:hypothetical protein
MFLRSAETKVGEVCEKLKEGLSKNVNGILLTLVLLRAIIDDF